MEEETAVQETQEEPTGIEEEPSTDPTYSETIDYEQMADAIYQRFYEGKEETGTFVSLPSGEILHVDYSADLSSLLVSLLLFTLITIQSFRWVSDTLKERRGG